MNLGKKILDPVTYILSSKWVLLFIYRLSPIWKSELRSSLVLDEQPDVNSSDVDPCLSLQC